MVKILLLTTTISLASFKYFNVTYHDTTKVAKFYNNGQVKIKGTKVNNFKHGKWFYYKMDGTVLKIEEYKKGKLIRDFQVGSLDSKREEKK